MTEILVTPGPVEPQGTFDLLITCLGYETRARHIAERFASLCAKKLALAFRHRLVAGYKKNLEFYQSHDFELLPFESLAFGKSLRDIIDESIPGSRNRARLLIDISSMSRPMIANLVVVLGEIRSVNGIDVTFTYCPAVFTGAPDVKQPVVVSQPVVPELAGWSIEPERSVAAVVGLGFEFDQALGAIEYLEPAAAWAFIPYGEDSRFDRALFEANKDLITGLRSDQIVKFDVKDPYKCFVELEALTYGLLDNMRPIIVPFGPKLFALLAFLVGVIHSPNVAVWRVSGDQIVAPEDRVASGRIVTLSTVFLSTDKRFV